MISSILSSFNWSSNQHLYKQKAINGEGQPGHHDHHHSSAQQSRKHLTSSRWVVASRQCIAGGRTKAVADKDKGQSISGPRCNGDGPVTVQIWFVRQVQVVIENIFRSCGQLEKRDVWAIGFYECRDTGGRPFLPDEPHSITLSAHPQRWLTLTMIASEITLRTSKKNWPHLGTGPKRLEASWWSAYIMKRV